MTPSTQKTVRTQADLAYVIQATSGDLIVKVGRSANPQTRFKQIRANVPFEVRLIAILSDGAHREREMKDLLSGHKVKGEWFSPTDKLNAYLGRAYDAKCVLTKRALDDEFSDEHLKPLVLEYLNGRTPKFNGPGDLVFRYLQCGLAAIEGRHQQLISGCEGVITPEFLAGYVSLPFGESCPQIVVPQGAAA